MEVNYLRDDLHKLIATTESVDSPASYHLAERVFFDIYDLGISGHVFSEDEKNELGPLLGIVMPNLEFCIRREYFHFPTSSYKSACYVRSGLQYLRDNYRDFPNLDGTLDTAIREWLDDSAVDYEEYDDWFKVFRGDPYEYDIHFGSEDEDADSRDPSHTWWHTQWPPKTATQSVIEERLSANDSQGQA